MKRPFWLPRWWKWERLKGLVPRCYFCHRRATQRATRDGDVAGWLWCGDKLCAQQVQREVDKRENRVATGGLR